MVWPLSSSWETKRDLKRAEQTDRLSKGRRALGATKNTPLREDLPYLSASASEIVSKCCVEKVWTAQRVLEAYIRSAARAHEATNCLTEVRFVEALEEAKKLDIFFATNKRPKGPLHGVPISLKDQISMAGVDSSLGASMHCQQPAPEDAAITTILRDAGAIVGFVKTNVPQTLLSFECKNPIWGATTNPYNAKAGPGGSSGGEAALLASDGSVAGIGSDVGGSCRIPAAMSGCFGLKPCGGRITDAAIPPFKAGFDAIRQSFGPMGRTVEDLELVAKVLIAGSKPFWHYKSMVPMPWRDQPLPNKLKIGYHLHDTFVETSPACLRAVNLCIEALRAQGHELVELPPADTVMASTIFGALSSADAYDGEFSHLGSDPIELHLTLFRLLTRMPGRSAVNLAAKGIDTKMAQMGSALGRKTVVELYEWQHKRDQFVERLRTDLWKTRALDGVICPVQAVPALETGASWNLLPLAAWTYIWNVCDSSVGVVPVTYVDKAKDERPANASFGNFSPLSMAAVYGTRLKRGVYDAKKMHGQPVGVQVVGPQYCEEKTLAMMKVLDKALGERGFSPGHFAKRRG